MPLYIEFDAVNGIAIPDGLAESYVQALIDNPPDSPFIVSSSIFIQALRVAVKEGRLQHSDVIIIFNSEPITIDSKGALSEWSKGFCSNERDFLVRLLKNK